MKHLAQKFTAHPVGQGLFYSGSVNISSDNIPDSSFRFVFDCGSFNRTNIAEEVAQFRQRHLTDGTTLDLLVISHFDADHVNHIKQLLENRIVKNVVLPFSSLEERLFLVLKYYDNGPEGTIPGDDFPIRFILDPIGSLGEHLDGDSTIYMVNSDPDKPIIGPGEGNSNGSDFSNNENITPRFEIINAADLDNNLAYDFYIGNASSGRLKMVNDSEKGFLTPGNVTFLMEFLFYRRDVGAENQQFFKAVFEAFCDRHALPVDDKTDVAVEDIIRKVKEIDTSKPISELMSEVRKKFPSLFTTGRDITNLNTTALCMLHYNLPAIYTLNHPEPVYRICKNITSIKKFDGTNNTRLENSEYDTCWYWSGRYNRLPSKRFPNCLLTSDNFIKRQEEVDAFYQKYQNYWMLFWLFQVPHHGAATSSDLTLLTTLPGRLTKFVNYGTTHDLVRFWRHPSPQLINDLIASGQSTHVLPVNEFTGLEFGINYSD